MSIKSASPEYPFAVFIGRMQPPHQKHIDLIRKALTLAEKTIVVLGSERSSRSIQNPFSAAERRKMLELCFSREELARIQFTGARDRLYNDNEWLAEVQNKVTEITDGIYPVALVGARKDDSSYYLDIFPRWKKLLEIRPLGGISSSAIREVMFEKGAAFVQEAARLHIPEAIIPFLLDFMASEQYAFLKEEWRRIREMREKWAASPYEPTFITTDAVCICLGHILMVRRKFQPGKGLIALPGGYLKKGLRLFDSALEELKEETRIKVDREDLRLFKKAAGVFDHPRRSPRGRIVTHAFLFQIPSKGELPEVKGGDDAEKAFWVPLADLYRREEEIFEDHLSIIDSMLGRVSV
jgi:bifunctional NMN adenylyltransferase/nudix hydrolase